MDRYDPDDDTAGGEMDGWWAISDAAFMGALRRAHAGEDPDLIFAEHYANSDHEDVT